MYYGAGFTHSDVYDMPVYLRNFYYNKLADTRKKENDEIKKANQAIQKAMRYMSRK